MMKTRNDIITKISFLFIFGGIKELKLRNIVTILDEHTKETHRVTSIKYDGIDILVVCDDSQEYNLNDLDYLELMFIAYQIL